MAKSEPKEAQIEVTITIDGERRNYSLDYFGGSMSGLNKSEGADLSDKIHGVLNSALWYDDGSSKVAGLAGEVETADE
jgi:hypothetical protein